MKLFLSGVFGALLGLVCLIYWWGAIVTIIKAIVTVFILGASSLALFLGYEEIQANIKAEKAGQTESGQQKGNNAGK